jgi:hypothetical protein
MYLLTLAIASTISVSALAQNLALSPVVRSKILGQAKELPVFFTTTEDGMLDLSRLQEDQMINFEHPLSEKSPVKAGLRFMPVSRRNLQKTLAPILQEGDIVLSFRSEWAGGGAYPSVQMGISHAGVIYKEGSTVANIDYPLNAEYVGKLDSKHYKETPLLHVIRPRNLSATQKKNLNDWAKLFVAQRASIYPAKVSFNGDYSTPRFNPNAAEPLSFVKDIARHALGMTAPAQTVFCSEFAWVLLALKDCSTTANKNDFQKTGIPSCVAPSFKPLPALGDFLQTQSDADQAGLADGPVLMMQKLELSGADLAKTITDIFVASATSRMSPGHRDVANEFAPLFAPLENYYKGYNSGAMEILGLKQIFNTKMNANYSPTAFMVNTLLPETNDHRAMDYVATLVFID